MFIFFSNKVQYVGHIGSKDGVEPILDKISKVDFCPKHCFGFAECYRKFIKDFVKVATPLSCVKTVGKNP